VPALSILGIVVFALLRLAYLLFYVRLRTTPEEVGYGYARILSESVVGSLELVVLVFSPLVVIGLLLHGALILWRKKHPSGRRGRDHELSTDGGRAHPIHRITVRAFLAALVTVVVSLPIMAFWQGGLAQRGQTVRNVYFVGVPYLPVLAVQAVPANVVWINAESEHQFDLGNRNCLLYLGRADGIDVFYDVRSHESVRIPSPNIAVSFRYTFFVDPNCRAP
jgi:hypothetical protein